MHRVARLSGDTVVLFSVLRSVALVCALAGCSVNHTGLAGSDPGPFSDAGLFDSEPFDSEPFDSAFFDGGPDARRPPDADDAGPDAGPDVFDAGTDAGPTDVGVDSGPPPPPPMILSASYGIVAHGGTTNLGGENLGTIASVTLGGVAVTHESSPGGFRIQVGDDVPLGEQPLLVTTDTGRTAGYELTVIHLVVNELDEEMVSGQDDRQFIEVATYVDSVLDLSGYVLVIFDGDDNRAFYAVGLGQTSASGLFMLGNSGVDGVAIQFNPEHLQAGMGIAIYQRDAYPTGRGGTASAEDLIDAVFFDDTGAEQDPQLSPILLVAGGRVTVEEQSRGNERRDSLQRCQRPRRDNRSWLALEPTPNAANTCP